ncbi:AraC family transcriptional regulator [Photobacterium leiognathi]|uniref:AraC family transcriptional regulator n=1 Tax=Photobacterium leiognathi TaxID=553611 RepID=UPI00298264CD|nr:AraC family transcriptional regulator [Photobacterium leiognathi]
MSDVKNELLFNDVISINQNINISGLTLLSLWDIVGNPITYKKKWPQDKILPLRSNSVVAVYTHSGNGQIHLYNGKIIRVQDHCVVFLNPLEISHYFCCGRVWALNWMEIITSGVIYLPIEQVIVLEDSSSRDEVTKAINEIKSNNDTYNRLGVARINKLIYEWLTYAVVDKPQHDAENKTLRVIEQIHLNIGKKWRISELSKIVPCSNTHLRKLFLKYTKQTPKEYILEAKLNYAYASIIHKCTPITTLALELNFYDSYHFSKAFKAKFGVCPSSCYEKNSNVK